MSHGIQDNKDHATNIVDRVDGMDNHSQSSGEAAIQREDFKPIQGTEADDALASMSLDDHIPIQSSTTGILVNPASLVDQNASASAVHNACIALKAELDTALDAYHQSRKEMQWHATNVCRVNMEYIRALQAEKHLSG